jgi:hypothetical protein
MKMANASVCARDGGDILERVEVSNAHLLGFVFGKCDFRSRKIFRIFGVASPSSVSCLERRSIGSKWSFRDTFGSYLGPSENSLSFLAALPSVYAHPIICSGALSLLISVTTLDRILKHRQLRDRVEQRESSSHVELIKAIIADLQVLYSIQLP